MATEEQPKPKFEDRTGIVLKLYSDRSGGSLGLHPNDHEWDLEKDKVLRACAVGKPVAIQNSSKGSSTMACIHDIRVSRTPEGGVNLDLMVDGVSSYGNLTLTKEQASNLLEGLKRERMTVMDSGM